MQDSSWISQFMSTKLAPALVPGLSGLKQYPKARAAVVAGFDELDLSNVGEISPADAKNTKRTQEVVENTAPRYRKGFGGL